MLKGGGLVLLAVCSVVHSQIFPSFYDRVLPLSKVNDYMLDVISETAADLEEEWSEEDVKSNEIPADLDQNSKKLLNVIQFADRMMSDPQTTRNIVSELIKARRHGEPKSANFNRIKRLLKRVLKSLTKSNSRVQRHCSSLEEKAEMLCSRVSMLDGMFSGWLDKKYGTDSSWNECCPQYLSEGTVECFEDLKTKRQNDVCERETNINWKACCSYDDVSRSGCIEEYKDRVCETLMTEDEESSESKSRERYGKRGGKRGGRQRKGRKGRGKHSDKESSSENESKSSEESWGLWSSDWTNVGYNRNGDWKSKFGDWKDKVGNWQAEIENKFEDWADKSSEEWKIFGRGSKWGLPERFSIGGNPEQLKDLWARFKDGRSSESGSDSSSGSDESSEEFWEEYKDALMCGLDNIDEDESSSMIEESGSSSLSHGRSQEHPGRGRGPGRGPHGHHDKSGSSERLYKGRHRGPQRGGRHGKSGRKSRESSETSSSASGSYQFSEHRRGHGKGHSVKRQMKGLFKRCCHAAYESRAWVNESCIESYIEWRNSSADYCPICAAGYIVCCFKGMWNDTGIEINLESVDLSLLTDMPTELVSKLIVKGKRIVDRHSNGSSSEEITESVKDQLCCEAGARNRVYGTEKECTQKYPLFARTFSDDVPDMCEEKFISCCQEPELAEVKNINISPYLGEGVFIPGYEDAELPDEMGMELYESMEEPSYSVSRVPFTASDEECCNLANERMFNMRRKDVTGCYEELKETVPFGDQPWSRLIYTSRCAKTFMRCCLEKISEQPQSSFRETIRRKGRQSWGGRKNGRPASDTARRPENKKFPTDPHMRQIGGAWAYVDDFGRREPQTAQRYLGIL